MVLRLAVLLPALAAAVGVRAGEVDRIVDRVAEIRQSSGMASAWLVMVDGDRLEYRTGRHWRTLVPVAPNLFRRPDDPVATAFIGEHDGKVYAQGEFGNWVRE